MKKTILALMGIALIATTALIYSCNKEENEATKENIVETKQDTGHNQNHWHDSYQAGFCPHFKYRIGFSDPCNQNSGTYCGHDIDAVLNGDETCYLMQWSHEDNLWTDMLMPIRLLIKNYAKELVTCAENGEPMIFHDDFNVLSKELVEFLGTDMIPAGKYNTYVTSYKGEKMVCIELGVIK